MYKDGKLERCECLTKHEKNILISALNTATIDVQRSLNESHRGINIIGTSPKDVREGLEMLMGDYSTLKYKVEKTPICHT